MLTQVAEQGAQGEDWPERGRQRQKIGEEEGGRKEGGRSREEGGREEKGGWEEAGWEEGGIEGTESCTLLSSTLHSAL